MSTPIDGAHVLVSEERGGTGEQYFAQGMAFTVAADSLDYREVTYPYPVRINTIVLKAIGDGDEGYAVVGEPGVGITIGSITADITVNDTDLNVSQTVIDNVKVGNYIVLADGTNTEEVKVTAVDDVNLTITVAAGINDAYAAATPTTVSKVVYMADKNLEFEAGEQITFGAYSTGGPLVPANTKIRIYYKNMDTGNSVRVRPKMEIWY
jgi:hypothetical protein